MLFLQFVVISILLSSTFWGGTASEAKDPAYPTKPITIIVPWAPGSSVDQVPRVMTPYLSKKLGVPINIVDKPGGSGVPATLEAVKAAQDGLTILSDCPGTSSIQMAWMKDLPYKVEDRTFMARAVVLPAAFVVRADAPWKTMQDVEQAIRKDPASFRWGGVGTTQSDFGIFLFKAALRRRGVDLSRTKTVSFQAATPAMIALAGGHIDLYFSSLPPILSFINAGKARVIGVARPERTKVYPGIPTTVEQGFPTIITDMWIGFCGPPGLPQPIVQTWETLVKEIVNDPAVLPEWDKIGGMPGFLPREEFKKFVMQEAKEIEAVTGQ